MLQHMLIISMAAAVSTFSGLVGCTTKDAASALAAALGDAARIEFDAWPHAAALGRAVTRECQARRCISSSGVSMPMKVAKSMVVRATISAIEN